MAQRGGAGFLKACMHALGVPGCGRKFKSWNADQTQKSPASLALTGFLLYAYKRRHALRNDAFSASSQVDVDVQGGFNVAVAEIFLHFFRLHAAVVQNTCRAVAQVVKAHVLQAVFAQHALKASCQTVGTEQDAVFVCANIGAFRIGGAILCSLFDLCFMLEQHVPNIFRHCEFAAAAFGFGAVFAFGG